MSMIQTQNAFLRTCFLEVLWYQLSSPWSAFPVIPIIFTWVWVPCDVNHLHMGQESPWFQLSSLWSDISVISIVFTLVPQKAEPSLKVCSALLCQGGQYRMRIDYEAERDRREYKNADHAGCCRTSFCCTFWGTTAASQGRFWRGKK